MLLLLAASPLLLLLTDTDAGRITGIVLSVMLFLFFLFVLIAAAIVLSVLQEFWSREVLLADRGIGDALSSGYTLIVWKLDRLGRSLPHLLAIVTDLKARGIAFRSLTEQMDTNTPHGELLFSLFGALAQYERALTRERVMAGLAAAKRRGRQGGRPPMIDTETLERITAALDGGASKASVCRTFKVPRSTLIGTLARIGWAPPARA